jgi:hypothetical protein
MSELERNEEVDWHHPYYTKDDYEMMERIRNAVNKLRHDHLWLNRKVR